MIVGDSIYLTPIDVEHAEIYRAWINDPEVNRWLVAGHIPITAASERKTVEEMDKSDASHEFEIRLREDDRPIGLVGLDHVEMVHRTGNIGIAIGEKDEQGKGRGRDALLTLMRYGFDTLGLNRMGISAFVGNDRALSLYRSLGFTETGRQRERALLHGVFRDCILFDMLEKEYRETYGSGS